MPEIVCAGVDIGATFVKIGLFTRDGSGIEKKQISTQKNGSPEALLGRIASAIQEMANQHAVRVMGVGIGTAGQVDLQKGVLHEAPNLPGWKDVPMAEILSRRLGVSVILDNDANVAAWGEYHYGAGRGSRHMLMITLGTGVGGGLVLDGRPYRGACDAAGEFGHIAIQLEGWTCGCGRKGCVEAYVGTQGIKRQVQEKLASGRTSLLSQIDPEALMPVDVSRAADQGDALALEVLRDTGLYLGQAIADVVNLLNLERVVIGGGVAKAGERILGPARETVQRVALRVPARVVEVVPAALGNEAGMIGASWLAFETVGSA